MCLSLDKSASSLLYMLWEGNACECHYITDKWVLQYKKQRSKQNKTKEQVENFPMWCEDWVSKN